MTEPTESMNIKSTQDGNGMIVNGETFEMCPQCESFTEHSDFKHIDYSKYLNKPTTVCERCYHELTDENPVGETRLKSEVCISRCSVCETLHPTFLLRDIDEGSVCTKCLNSTDIDVDL